MTRSRLKPDGLPYRLYERRGKRVYSIGYKAPDGTWSFRLKCPVGDRARAAECRREAIQRAAVLHNPAASEGPLTFEVLCKTWLERQHALPLNVKEKRASSTLAENEHEIATLNKAFGPMRISDITRAHCQAYLDACLVAVDDTGKPRPRPEKGNKEIALARAIFEYAIARDHVSANPFKGPKKVGLDKPKPRYVSTDELERALKVGREMGGAYHIMALCMKTAYLCYRRSFEARNLTRDMITADGILWKASKRRKGQSDKHVLVEWSPELKTTIDEALKCPRHKGVGTFFVFGNLAGRAYTKGGWKANLTRLMTRCKQDAAQERKPFEPFSLQECRPKAVSDELANNGGDVKALLNATLHTNERMIQRHYDRRSATRAAPVGGGKYSKIGISKNKRG